LGSDPRHSLGLYQFSIRASAGRKTKQSQPPRCYRFLQQQPAKPPRMRHNLLKRTSQSFDENFQQSGIIAELFIDPLHAALLKVAHLPLLSQ
jgi:hypothetical protein